MLLFVLKIHVVILHTLPVYTAALPVVVPEVDVLVAAEVVRVAAVATDSKYEGSNREIGAFLYKFLRISCNLGRSHTQQE